MADVGTLLRFRQRIWLRSFTKIEVRQKFSRSSLVGTGMPPRGNSCT